MCTYLTWRTLCALFAALILPFTVHATMYFVDSGPAGDDSHGGTSTAYPWKSLAKVNSMTFNPGDRIRFVRGGVWYGRLAPQGSGSSSASIRIDAYATGDAPRIEAGGSSTEALYLYNQQYWEIEDLELTHSATTEGTRYGVRIAAEDFGAVHHIHLRDLEVRDITGDSSDKNTGGIFFEITGSSTPTYFNDVLIEGCYVHDVIRTGISISSSWDDRTATVNTTWTPSTNVIIRDNYIADTWANGLIWRVSSEALIEGNVWDGCAHTGSGNAMFVFNCDDVIIQYNEAFGTVYNTGDIDAAGFDVDFKNKRIVVQYNYAHNNGLGGIVAVCPNYSFNIDPVIRYNVLLDNEREGFRISGNVTGAEIYNNTVYVSEGISDVKAVYHKNWGAWPDDTQYRNNIFATHGSDPSYVLGSSTATSFDYNVYHGESSSSEPTDTHKLTSNPFLAEPGTGGTGWESLDGYQLATGSPALSSGTLIADNGGLDFWGNGVSATSIPSRGAYEGTGVTPVPFLVETEFEDLPIAASSGDATNVISDGSASGGDWLKFYSDAADFITFPIEVAAGTYEIELRVKRYNDRAQIQLAVADSLSGTYQNLDTSKDCYNSGGAYTTFVFDDAVTFETSGTMYFRLTVTGKNTSSSGYVVSLDSLTLTPL